jgi:hypothetical protein
MKVHDIAYARNARTVCGANGGACIADSPYYGASNDSINNNVFYRCGPRGQRNSTIHGIYTQEPGSRIFNNIGWGISGVCVATWHASTNIKIINNTFVDCLDGASGADSGGQNWPHILTGTPMNGSTTIRGLSTTAGIAVGSGVKDTTNTACLGASDYAHQVTAINGGANSVTITPAAGSSGCGTGDTLTFSYPNTGSFMANNIALNDGIGAIAEFGNTGTNTFTNNHLAGNSTWQLKNSTHTNDVSGNPGFIRYTPNDGNDSDFRLGPGSPDIGAGTATNAPRFDHEGNLARLGSAPDVGAHAYNPVRQ